MGQADGIIVIETDLDTKKFEAKMQKLQNRLNQQSDKSNELNLKLDKVNKELSQMEQYDLGSKQWEKLVNQAVVLEDQLVKSDSTIEEIKSQMNLLSLEKIEKDSRKTNATLEKISRKMSDVVKKGLKWGLAIFSVRTAYTVVSRAAQSYLSINEELSNKMQSVWTGLGSMLEPVLTSIINVMSKGVAILNHFIYQLTGIDYVARANAKSLNAQAKAQKSLNKEMAVFDEMSKIGSLDNDGGKNNSQITLPELNEEEMNIIDNVALKIEEIVKKFEEWKTTWDELNDSISPIVLLLGVGGLIGILTGKGGLVLALGIAGVAITGLVEIMNGDFTQAIEGIILLLGAAGLIEVLTGKTGLYMAIADVILILQGLSDLFSKDATDSVKGFIELVVGAGGLLVTLSLIKGGASAGLLGILTPLNLVIFGFAALAGGIVAVVKSWGNMNTLERVISILGLIAIGAATAAAAVGALQSAWSLGIAAAAIVAGTIAIATSISSANKRAQENIPKLAVGGIVNVPGSGVPVGRAIAGEAGAEGVIPLTDTQAMETLGATIGKYININATVPVYVGNRQIAREIKKINAENDFAFNR